MDKTIAIQGIKGSNHHLVAEKLFGENCQVLECLSFDALIDGLINGEADTAVMAIENSIAGSIIPNYNLVYHHRLWVNGEFYQRIDHDLMALPGQNLEDLEEVRSHPMAILQCKEFLRKYPHIRRVEAQDTALSAKLISDRQIKGVAAIAPSLSAQLYGLKVLGSSIQTIDNNSTRFIILEKEQTEQNIEKINKASLRFITDHKRGSLATVLNVMSDCHLNLSKIQSLPVIESPWKYAFFVDVCFEEYSEYQKAKSLLQIMTEEFLVMGEYENTLNK